MTEVNDFTPPQPNEDLIEPDEIGFDLEEAVGELLVERRSRAEVLIQQNKSVVEIIRETDNDYSLLRAYYQSVVGNDLLADAKHSPEKEIVITKSCSIVIPSYNNFNRLQNCLNAIYESSFFKKYPQLLEVVVVDDGSTNEDMSEKIMEMDLPGLDVKVYREINGGAAKARYSGVLNSTGEIVLMTDPDIIYTPNAIEEYMKRHQVLQSVVFFGLRDEIDSEDARLTKESMAEGSLATLPDDITMDPRLANDSMAKTDWLKKSGNDAKLPLDEDDERYDWRLKNIAWSFSISAEREDVLRILAAYDQGYVGYGGEDEDMNARLLALGNYVIPMTGGFCYHQRHQSANVNEERRQANIEVLNRNLNSELKEQDPKNPQPTDAELKYSSK